LPREMVVLGHYLKWTNCDKLWFYHSSYLEVQTMVEP
jgi:hypothetical protein